MLEISQHHQKCYLRACIGFSYALFHIFSGPLFANVEGYLYLDLLVWGLSPLFFLFVRDEMFVFFRGQMRNKRHKILQGILAICGVIFVSYFFLNYSPVFNWNYFSRTFNIEVGFFLFDMSIRTLDLIVQLDNSTSRSHKHHIPHQSLPGFDSQPTLPPLCSSQLPDCSVNTSKSQSAPPDWAPECNSYCQVQHISLSLSYFLVFYLSSSFDVNQRNNGWFIFAVCSCFSFMAVLMVPLLYLCCTNETGYEGVDDGDDQIASDQYAEEIENPNNSYTISTNKKSSLFSLPLSTLSALTGLSLLNISLIINTSYFSLFMMQPLGTTSDSSYQQYNITIQMVSGFFLVSLVGYYLAYRIFEELDQKKAVRIVKAVLIVYGVALMLGYWNYGVNYVSGLVLGFGFHQISAMEMMGIVNAKVEVDMRLYLKNEVFAYFVMPITFMLFNYGQSTLKLYLFASGAFLTLGAVLI